MGACAGPRGGGQSFPNPSWSSRTPAWPHLWNDAGPRRISLAAGSQRGRPRAPPAWIPDSRFTSWKLCCLGEVQIFSITNNEMFIRLLRP